MENNFPLIFTIFAFLSDFKIPALANDGGYHDNEKSIFFIFNFSVVYDVLFWQPSSKRAGFNERYFI